MRGEDGRCPHEAGAHDRLLADVADLVRTVRGRARRPGRVFDETLEASIDEERRMIPGTLLCEMSDEAFCDLRDKAILLNGLWDGETADIRVIARRMAADDDLMEAYRTYHTTLIGTVPQSRACRANLRRIRPFAPERGKAPNPLATLRRLEEAGHDVSAHVDECARLSRELWGHAWHRDSEPLVITALSMGDCGASLVAALDGIARLLEEPA